MGERFYVRQPSVGCPCGSELARESGVSVTGDVSGMTSSRASSTPTLNVCSEQSQHPTQTAFEPNVFHRYPYRPGDTYPGNTNENRIRPATGCSTITRPPCRCMIALTMASPSPFESEL